MSGIFGKETGQARSRMAVKVGARQIFGLVELLNELHGKMAKTIMIQLEFLLSGRQIRVARIVDGNNVAVAAGFFAVDEFVVTKFGVNEGQPRRRIDVSMNSLGKELSIVRVDFDVKGHPVGAATVVLDRRIEVVIAAVILRREKTHLNRGRVVTRNSDGTVVTVFRSDIPAQDAETFDLGLTVSGVDKTEITKSELTVKIFLEAGTRDGATGINEDAKYLVRGILRLIRTGCSQEMRVVNEMVLTDGSVQDSWFERQIEKELNKMIG